MTKPLLIYDGDCTFCRRWIARWKKLTGDGVDYAPSQEVADRFPEIPRKSFAASVHWIGPDGTHFAGAEAVFRTLESAGKKTPLWLYRNVPLVKPITEGFYRLVASHRVLFSRLTRFFWGKNLEPSTYAVTRRVFLSLLGVVYLAAFVSLAVQVKGLIGSGGILPAAPFLKAVAEHLGKERYGLLPTLFWFNSSDLFLQGVCWAGALLALGLIFGLAPVPILFLLWFFYLSLFHVGGVFLGYQWDVLLLETGFLALFFAPLKWRMKGAGEPPRAFLWLLRWLLFRLTFSSGMVKLFSGDPAWRDLTALTYHYETQPLPTWIGYYASQLPIWFQKFSCASMFGIEIGVPFLIFTPKRLRQTGGLLMISLQVLIMATGNYNFFNLLTMALCLTLFDDASLGRFQFLSRGSASGSRNWPKGVIGFVGLFIFVLSWIPFLGRLAEFRDWPRPIRWIYAKVDRLELVGGYGLFAVMTKDRPEITVEGSRDGATWLPYEFRWKPGDPKERPKFVEPHQPRLDWQMWFQSLAPYHPHSWFQNFLVRLLEGSPDVLALMKKNPFPEGPPRYIRANIADFHFTDLATQKATGEWWKRGPERPYAPVLSFESP